MKLSDAEAKDILRNWSRCPQLFGGTAERPWLRAQPKEPNKHASTPCIRNAGGRALATRPDGMWVRLPSASHSADVFCVEVCGSMQNLQDKRSRFLPSTSSLVLHLPEDWLNEAINSHNPRREKFGFDAPVKEPVVIPIRYLRVLMALPDDAFELFLEHGVASGHEYYIRHSSLASYKSQDMQKFLKGISPDKHFYGKKSSVSK